MNHPHGDAAWHRREASRKRKAFIWQSAILVVLTIIFGSFIFNISANLAARNIHSGFAFLHEQAGFEIGESLISFSSTEAYFKAFLVGLLNTIKVSVVSIITATVLGVIIGLMRLSKHPLLKFLGAAHVEFYRNIPLIVQLLLIYLIFAVPASNSTACTWSFVAAGLAFFLTRPLFLKIYTGLISTVFSLSTALVVGGAAWLCFGIFGGWSKPELQGFAIEGGASLSPEFLALWIGLTFFTSSSIAEIIRAGVLAVPRGQWHAAEALGMTRLEAISYVIFPQALKLAIPPLASQYMNLTKNSSLAVVVGYPDLVSIGNSTINLNGQALEVIVIIMSVYLFLNLVISVVMNSINRIVIRGSR